MKFGILTLKKAINRSLNSCHNVGDNIQAIAMRDFYVRVLGISENEIVEIDYHDLSTYSGEKVILPINFYFPSLSDAKEVWFPTSKYIKPVFTGLHLENYSLSENDIRYLKQNEPIGCRDEYTYRLMLKSGIDAYIGGCITTTMAFRANSNDFLSTYIVDVPSDVETELPREYRNNVIYRSHELTAPMNEDGYIKTDLYARELLDEYRNNARLVITSRLHCAAPCYAMGIPVVLVLNEKKATFSWIDRLVPTYMWNEKKSFTCKIDVQNYYIKDLITNCNKKRIMGLDAVSEMKQLTEFFIDEGHADYTSVFNKVKNSIDLIARSKYKITYAIWGATSLAEETYNYISNNYGNRISLKLFVDEYNEVMFHNQRSQKFNSSDISDIDFWVVTPAHGKEEIKKQFLNSESNGLIIWYDGSTSEIHNHL